MSEAEAFSSRDPHFYHSLLESTGSLSTLSPVFYCTPKRIAFMRVYREYLAIISVHT
jgi:hypothetical protein